MDPEARGCIPIIIQSCRCCCCQLPSALNTPGLSYRRRKNHNLTVLYLHVDYVLYVHT